MLVEACRVFRGVTLLTWGFLAVVVFITYSEEFAKLRKEEGIATAIALMLMTITLMAMAIGFVFSMAVLGIRIICL